MVTKVLMLALLPLLVAAPFIQNTESPIEFLGLIEAINQNTITVNGQVIDILGAQVNVPLAVGTAVEVEAVIASDGRFVARQVNPASLLPNEVEIIGTLQAFNGATITVSGQVIDIQGAQINALIPIGSRIRVRASLSPQGAWVASQVDAFVRNTTPALTPGVILLTPSPNPLLPSQTPEVLAPVQTPEVVPNDEFEIVGTLEEIGDGFIVVASQRISIVGAEINDPLIQGERVKVHLRIIDGQLVAREVERADLDDNGRDDNSGRGGDDNSGGSNDDDNSGMGMGSGSGSGNSGMGG
jgi:hypothetical protein